jgi:uncharacterized membrane protein YkvA (DUF1232 family)
LCRPCYTSAMGVLNHWKARARQLRTDVYALYFACRDPRTPWYAKLLAAVVVAYALSPIDLIPDFIPILGYLDDLILVPLGILAVIRFIPPAVLAECRQRAAEATSRPTSRTAAVIIVACWLTAAGLALAWISGLVKI